jgi:hypothetical protein
MQNQILKRLEELKNNSEKDVIEISINYKDKKVYNYEIEIEGFKKEVMEDKESSLFYFFKDVTVDLEEILIQKHREIIFKEIEKKGE